MGSNFNDYVGAPEKVVFKGILFDMDGTIIDSTEAVEKHWHTIGTELGLDPEVILQTSHGRRSIDTLKELCPEKANWEYVKYVEGLLPIRYGHTAVEIPGARSLLAEVTKTNIPWTIVTSGTTPLVTGWLNLLHLPIPPHLIVAEDVEHGKPSPECYLLGRSKLFPSSPSPSSTDSTNPILVIEDSPAGIISGKKAGCKVLAVVTSHTIQQVIAAGPDWIVRDLRSVSVVGNGEGEIELEFRDLWVVG